jgi:excisionase family DNA binding protein
MQAYATMERPATGQSLHILSPTPQGVAGDVPAQVLLDQLLGRLVDLVADRLLERTAAPSAAQASDWMDAREAAAYLAIHRDTVRKLAAQRVIPAHQDGPRCKLYFRREELDDWRRSARPMSTPRLRAVS